MMNLGSSVLRGTDRGMSLVELLVSIMITGVLGVVVTSLYVSTVTTTAEVSSVTLNTRQAANGMNEIARVIRAATENPVQGQPLSDAAFVSTVAAPLGAESLTVYAYVNLSSAAEVPVKIRFDLDDERRLVETQWASTPLTGGYFSFQSTPLSTRILASTVAPASPGQPALFRYLLADGTELVPPPTGTLTTAQLRSIVSVHVTLTMQETLTDSRAAVTLENTVGIPNLALSRSAS
jgi:prepilin-type N-terminal cleavage/methylation domain-containing protein